MRDEWFIRGDVPMTKSEVRAVSVSKLELPCDGVLYDVGAGTGSVAIEASRLLTEGRVYAVERNPEALSLIAENRARFQADNVTVVCGEAPKALEGLERPSHVFLGGSGGQMEKILKEILERNPAVRIVANVIALESLCEILNLAGRYGLETEVVSVQVARARKTGAYHLMQGQNPVYVIAMERGERKEGGEGH